eukprot:5265732-Lingulodinium_polyedra.AAC.1
MTALTRAADQGVRPPKAGRPSSGASGANHSSGGAQTTAHCHRARQLCSRKRNWAASPPWSEISHRRAC